MQVLLSLSLSPSVLTFYLFWLFIVFSYFFSLCIFFLPLLSLSSLSSKGIQKERTHMHTHYLGQTGHIWGLSELLCCYTSIQPVSDVCFICFLNDISPAHSCRYHHLHRLLGKQWSHRHRWRTKRTDRIRHSVQPKWPGTSSDQTDLLQLHSSSSL